VAKLAPVAPLGMRHLGVLANREAAPNERSRDYQVVSRGDPDRPLGHSHDFVDAEPPIFPDVDCERLLQVVRVQDVLDVVEDDERLPGKQK